MRRIAAEEQLRYIEAASFPHCNKKARKDIQKRYRKAIEIGQEKKRLSLKEAMEAINGR